MGFGAEAKLQDLRRVAEYIKHRAHLQLAVRVPIYLFLFCKVGSCLLWP